MPPDEYQKENRRRIIDLEKGMTDLKVGQGKGLTATEALSKQVEQHQEYARSQHTATNTGLTDLKDTLQARQDKEDERRHEIEKAQAAAATAQAIEDAAQGTQDAADAKTNEHNSKANADKWATIKSAFTPQTVLLLISLVGALFGKAVIDQTQQAALVQQVIEQQAEEAPKKLSTSQPSKRPPSSDPLQP